MLEASPKQKREQEWDVLLNDDGYNNKKWNGWNLDVRNSVTNNNNKKKNIGWTWWCGFEHWVNNCVHTLLHLYYCKIYEN